MNPRLLNPSPVFPFYHGSWCNECTCRGPHPAAPAQLSLCRSLVSKPYYTGASVPLHRAPATVPGRVAQHRLGGERAKKGASRDISPREQAKARWQYSSSSQVMLLNPAEASVMQQGAWTSSRQPPGEESRAPGTTRQFLALHFHGPSA